MPYGEVERKIAEYATRFPLTKAIAKRVYQYFMFTLFRKRYCVWIRNGIHLENGLGDNTHGSFFGYYTLTSRSNNRQLWHRFPKALGTTIRSTKPIDIMMDKEKIGSTTAWNWQQGSMLHWYDNNTAIWNDFDETNNTWITKIYRNNTIETREFPTYASNSTSGIVACLDFHRLARYRPDYGYFNLPWKDIPPLSNDDGISIRSFDDGKIIRFIPIGEITQNVFKSGDLPVFQKLNHAVFSPSGKRVMFLHRWREQNGVKWTRLLSYEIGSKTLTPLAHQRLISHCCWDGDDAIIGWMRGDSGDHYYRIDILTGEHSIIGLDQLNEDGHPTLSKCGRWLLTDTYPARDRISSLLIYDRQFNKAHVIGQFYSPLIYNGECRCDLHPRWSDDNRTISIDSTHEGIRRLYTISFDPAAIESGCVL